MSDGSSRRSAARAAIAAGVAGVILIIIAVVMAGGGDDTASPPARTAPQSVTLLTGKSSFGEYLTDGSGRSLYMWEADRGGEPTCYDACAEAWPPLVVAKGSSAAAVTVTDGLDKELMGLVTRSDGTEQVTYGGWPLYYFAPDQRAGQFTGQGDTGFGAVWWLVSPSGKPLPSPIE